MDVQADDSKENCKLTETRKKPVSECSVYSCDYNRRKKYHKPGIKRHYFPKNKLLCLKWMSFCQNPELDKKTPEELSAKESHFICSQHFSDLDYFVSNWSDVHQIRLSRSGAVPKTLGPNVLDEDGTFISPIKPPKNEYAARLVGLQATLAGNPEVEEDEEEEWQYSDFCEVEAAFRGDDEQEEPIFERPPPKSTKPREAAKTMETGLFQDIEKQIGAVKKVRKYKKLPDDVKQLRHKIHNLRRINNRIKKASKKKPSKKEQHQAAVEYLKLVLNEVQFELVFCLITNSSRSRRGRRYSLQLKIICLGLYLFDPRAYENLRKVFGCLPSSDTLEMLLNNNKVKEGFNDFVFDALKCISLDFGDVSKYVLIAWDGMNMAPELHYAKESDGGGHLVGLDGKEPATQVDVVMVKSLFGGFKLPIGYFFHDAHLNSEKLKPIIDESIKRVNETGLKVKALVCDQCSAHQTLYRTLFGVTAKKPYLVVDGERVYCFFDAPHLLKNIRNNMKKYIAVFKDADGKEMHASWAHLIQFFNLDSSNLTRVAPKLTWDHIYGAPVTHMNVAVAAQVLSRSVAGGVKQAVEAGKLNPEALGLAFICETMNDLFDSFNCKIPDLQEGEVPKVGIRDFVPPASFNKPRRPLKLPATEESPHKECWQNAKTFLKTLRFYRPSTDSFFRPPCVTGWLLSISSAELLCQEFWSLDCKEVPIGVINQDFVENLFSQVRYRNGHPDVTCREFEQVFKFLLVQHIMDPTRGKNPNCKFDEARFLDVFGALAKKAQHKAPQQPTQQIGDPGEAEWDDDEEDVDVELGDEFEDYDPSENPGDVKYSSYLSRRLIIHSGQCQICNSTFSVSKEDRDSQHSILTLTENERSDYSYVAATVATQEVVHRATEAFASVLRQSYHEEGLGFKLSKAITSVRGFNEIFSHCPLHDGKNKVFFVKVTTSSLMRHFLRQQNKNLKAYIKASRGKTKVASLAASTKIFALFDDHWLQKKDVVKDSEKKSTKVPAPRSTKNIKYSQLADNLAAARDRAGTRDTTVLFGAPKRKLIPVETEEVVDDGVAPFEDSTVGEFSSPSIRFQSTPRTYGKRIVIDDNFKSPTTRPRAQSFSCSTPNQPNKQQTFISPKTTNMNPVDVPSPLLIRSRTQSFSSATPRLVNVHPVNQQAVNQIRPRTTSVGARPVLVQTTGGQQQRVIHILQRTGEPRQIIKLVQLPPKD